MKPRLPAEWEDQDGVLLAWPHEDTDWRDHLELVEPVFDAISAAITRFERLLVVAADTERVRRRMETAGARADRVLIYTLPTNDTWARDFGPLTVERAGKPLLLDFGFNGWGLKFPADKDNRVTRGLAALGAFAAPVKTCGLVLEGGSVESDGRGTLMTTSRCLLESNRNPHLDRAGVETALSAHLGADRVLWIGAGHLEGDDTDSHVDTLARFAPDDTIVHVACDDPEDEHFDLLVQMVRELDAFRTLEGKPFRRIPLPWPRARFDAEGRRLPATYANFLVLNGAVLVPTYRDPNDGPALSAVGEAFPGREILAVDCTPLILQHGSLHCVTMHLPRGVLP